MPPRGGGVMRETICIVGVIVVALVAIIAVYKMARFIITKK